MSQDRPGRGVRLWGSVGGLCALSLCFALAIPSWREGRVPDSPKVSAPVAAQAQETPLDALAQFRAEREAVREVEARQLRDVAGDETVSQEVREAAGRQLLALLEHMEQEVTLEGLLRAQGFSDVVCSAHADSVNVLVGLDALTRAQSALILDMAMRETGQAGGSVRVIPVGW